MAQTSRRRYEILSTLGRGGFGTVYRAQLLGDGGFRKLVALKVLSDEVGHQAELARRLRDEARILGLLRHRAVVQVDDLVELDGRWTVVMELVDGVDLGFVAEHGGMPLRPALEVVQEVASALHAAWTAPGPEGAPLRIVHRDIKPGNILLSTSGEVKILDFGIARAEFEDREAVTRSVGFGSPEYMSPERLEWQSGPEGDLYALGAVLYELLNGMRLGMSSGHPVRHARRVDEALAGLGERLGPEGEGTIALLRRLLAYEPADRPTARELERACDPLIAAASGGRLRDWAESHVLELKSRRGALAADISEGRVLQEASATSQPTVYLDLQDGPSAGPPAPTPTPSPVEPPTLSVPVAPPDSSPQPAVTETSEDLELSPVGREARRSLLAFALLAGLAVTAAVLWPSESPPTPEPAAAPVEAPAPVVGAPPAEPSAPTAPPEETVTPAEAKPASSTRSTGTAARASPAPPSTTEAAAESPAAEIAPSTGRVLVTGDAQSVSLKGSASTYAAPGEVPPGDYEVLVTFPDRAPIASGTISVLAGGRVTLACSAQFKRCNAR